MSDKPVVEEKKKPITTIEPALNEHGQQEYALVGTARVPIMNYSREERKVKQRDGTEKTIKGRTWFRGVIPDAGTAGLVVQQAFAQVPVEQHKDLAERIFGHWLNDASETGLVNDRTGNTSWSPVAYVKGMLSPEHKRAGNSLADLEKEVNSVLALLVSVAEWKEKWKNAKDEAIAAGVIEALPDGNLSGDPFSDVDWNEASTALERKLTDIDALLELQMNGYARRLDLERQINEKAAAQEKAKQEREKKKAQREADEKAKAAATADVVAAATT